MNIKITKENFSNWYLEQIKLKDMNVQLKKVKFFEGHDTMTGFNADVWINGVKCMHVLDTAHGGCYEYSNYTYGAKNPEKIKSLIKEYSEYVKTLPPVKYEHGGQTHELPMDMDLHINELLEELERGNAKKKLEKKMVNAILFGIPNGDKFTMVKYKKPLKDIPRTILQQEVNRVLKEDCVNGVQILNTNLKELGITV